MMILLIATGKRSRPSLASWHLARQQDHHKLIIIHNQACDHYRDIDRCHPMILRAPIETGIQARTTFHLEGHHITDKRKVWITRLRWARKRIKMRRHKTTATLAPEISAILTISANSSLLVVQISQSIAPLIIWVRSLIPRWLSSSLTSIRRPRLKLSEQTAP